MTKSIIYNHYLVYFMTESIIYNNYGVVAPVR